jgi:peptidyl-prolyl cis-trans isomerase C
MMPLNRTFLAAIVAAFAVTGCDRPESNVARDAPIDNSAVLATVNGEPITQEAVDHLIAQIQRPVHSDPEKARELIVEELIRRKILADYAAERELDRELDVHLSLERQREAVLVGAARRQIVESAPVITEEQMRQRYEQEIERGPKVEYRVRHIILDTEPAANEAIAEITGGKKFEDVARERSTGPTREKGGDLGWLRPGMVVPEFFTAVEALSAGEHTTSPVHTAFGWHVIRLDETRPLTPAPFDQIKNQIETMLRQQRFEEKFEELRGRAEITMAGESPAPGTTPPGKAPSAY